MSLETIAIVGVTEQEAEQLRVDARLAAILAPLGHAALVSQLPMVALMVGYTMVSLWILAQPIMG